MHVMSSPTVRMGAAVVAGMAAGGCNDRRRTAVGVNGNGEGISNVSVRRATLSDACSMTSIIIDAHRHSTSLFAVEGSTRVSPDGTQGARAIVCGVDVLVCFLCGNVFPFFFYTEGFMHEVFTTL